MDGCVIVDEKCVNDCYNMKNRYECNKEYLNDCRWIFSKHTGDDGICVWKENNNYSCSDIKRYNQCKDGGGINILFKECEFYKNGCIKKCELYMNEEKCLIDGHGDCVWQRNISGGIKSGCLLKVLL
jgi:hypothetical protein